MADLAESFRREAGRCTATLIRVLRDLDLAQDAVAEAFAFSAEQRPTKDVHRGARVHGAAVLTTALGPAGR